MGGGEVWRFICGTCAASSSSTWILLEKEAGVPRKLLPGIAEEAWTVPEEGLNNEMSAGTLGSLNLDTLEISLSGWGALSTLFAFLLRPFSPETQRVVFLTRCPCREQEDDSQGPQEAVALVTREDDCNLMKPTPSSSPYIFLGMCLIDYWYLGRV